MVAECIYKQAVIFPHLGGVLFPKFGHVLHVLDLFAIQNLVDCFFGRVVNQGLIAVVI